MSNFIGLLLDFYAACFAGLFLGIAADVFMMTQEAKP